MGTTDEVFAAMTIPCSPPERRAASRIGIRKENSIRPMKILLSSSKTVKNLLNIAKLQTRDPGASISHHTTTGTSG